MSPSKLFQVFVDDFHLNHICLEIKAKFIKMGWHIIKMFTKLNNSIIVLLTPGMFG